MVRPKKEEEKKVEYSPTKVQEVSTKDQLVKLLCDNISRVFDREPGSYSRSAVDKLAENIINLLK